MANALGSGGDGGTVLVLLGFVLILDIWQVAHPLMYSGGVVFSCWATSSIVAV